MFARALFVVGGLLIGGEACSFTPGAPSQGGSATIDAPAGVIPMLDAPRAPDAPLTDGPCPDADHDGVCDSVDDWPCGAKPTAPPATVAMTGNNGDTQITVSQTSLGGGLYAVAAPGANVNLSIHYAINDTACPGNCVDQIEVGPIPGAREGCIFDATVSKTSGAVGNASMQLTAPGTAGTYDIRVHIGQNYSCTYQGASGWWQGNAPAANLTIAKLCVH